MGTVEIFDTTRDPQSTLPAMLNHHRLALVLDHGRLRSVGV